MIFFYPLKGRSLCKKEPTMKINVLRNLVIPWMMLFAAILIGAVVTGVHFHLQAKDQSLYLIAIATGVLFSVASNINTLSTAGIWITHSLPSSLRYNSWPWLFSALLPSP